MSKERPADIKCVIIRECTIILHFTKSATIMDSGVDSEWTRVKLLLAKTGDVQRSIYC